MRIRRCGSVAFLLEYLVDLGRQDEIVFAQSAYGMSRQFDS